MKTFNVEDILDRLKHYLNVQSDSALADYLGVTKSTLSNWKKRESIDYELIFTKCERADYNWLLTGKGEMIHAAPAVPVPAGRGIPLLPTAALCGFGTPAFDDLPVMGYYSVPEFRNADFLIGLIGDSMTPRFVPGDIVACRIVRERLFFQWNRIYAIYTGSQGAMVKRVKPSKQEGCILLISDNPNYEPFDIPLSDITALALVIGVIRVE